MRAVDATGVDPGRLELELTESLLMKEPQQASQILKELRAFGIGGISIDDFGTGYSSLAYLKRFPITGLKIDRSFVSGISQSSQDEAIVHAILALAKSLDLRVTAEGVETLEQATSLAVRDAMNFRVIILASQSQWKTLSRLCMALALKLICRSITNKARIIP